MPAAARLSICSWCQYAIPFHMLDAVKGIRRAAIEIIEEEQPYATGDRPSAEAHFLSVLKSFSDVDKHRTLYASAVVTPDVERLQNDCAGSTDLYHAQPDVVADEAAISGVAPVTHAHVNTLGRYELHRQPPPAGQLRPLRQSDENDGAIPAPPLGVSGDKH